MKVKLIILCGIAILLGLTRCNYSSYKKVVISDKKWVKIAGKDERFPERISPIHYFDDNYGIASAGTGMKVTYNAGRTWETSQLFQSSIIQSFNFFSNQDGLAVGGSTENMPVVMKTNNAGKRWDKLKLNESNNLEDLKKVKIFQRVCLDNTGTIGWAIGHIGLVKIRIEEKFWTVLNIVKTDEPLYRMVCDDPNEIFAIGFGNKIYHFKDKLEIIELSEKSSLLNIIRTEDTLWLLGVNILDGKPKTSSQAWLKMSQDGGKTWLDKTPKNLEAEFLSDLYLKNGVGWVIGTAGVIYYTQNNGESWVLLEKVTDNSLSQIFMLNENNGWIVGSNKTILRYN